MIFKLKFKKLGGHVHVSVWSGVNAAALGRCGDLIFRPDEWALFEDILADGPLGRSDVEEVIIEEVTGIPAPDLAWPT